MAMSSALTLLLFCLVLCTQALEQQPPLGRRSKRDFMTSMVSFFSNVDKRLDAVEARFDNSTEERLTQLETKMEGEMQEKLQDVDKKLQDMDEKLQDVQDSMQRLESMINVMTEKMAEMTEAKANATEESAASLEATKTEPQSSSATCQYQYQYQFERETSRSSGEQQRMAKLESELTRLQEKVSALDKHLQDNEVSVESLQNASTKAMEGIVHSMTELVAASEQNFKSTMENATKIFYDSTTSIMNATFLASMMSDSEARLLARVENNAAVFNASMARVEQTTKELATQVSAVEDRLDNATSLHAENIRVMLENIKNTTKETCGTPQYKRTCQDYYDCGIRSSAVYTLDLEDGRRPVEVYCDMSSGTGWVVFQRREDGSVNFYRDWKNYRDGFGDLYGEFWLGNRNIHRLTSAGLTQLRVNLQAWNGSTAFASYSHFRVGDASSSYTLSVSGYSGTAADSLTHHSGHKFTTFDRDNDVDSGNCAQQRKGAYWYSSCTTSNLNGEYGARGSSGDQYIFWDGFFSRQSLQRTELQLK